MIRVQHLVKRFGRNTAVDDVSLDISAGDSVAFWGANGAGKTTIIRCVLGLLRFRGTITVGGHDVQRRGKHARQLIGYVPQELGFYDDLGVAEAVGYFAGLKGLRVRSADDAIASVGLAGHGRKRIRELSGGMKQRLALAVALLGNPPVLVLDEVTASLDACGREAFIGLLGELSTAGRTMLFASHRVEEVTSLAKRVVVLEKGRITSETPAAHFVPSLGVGSVLHLRIGSGARHAAAALLQAYGFEARLNGTGIYVPVADSQKAAPFRVLANASIAVDDFELLAGRPPARRTEETTP